jgi:hypothetical protein
MLLNWTVFFGNIPEACFKVPCFVSKQHIRRGDFIEWFDSVS